MKKIINIQPKINPEGYFQDNIETDKDFNLVLIKKISLINLEKLSFNNDRDKKILEEIIKNHKDFLIEKKIEEGKFLINDMEINELKKIE